MKAMTKEKPINFNGQMVRAILEGRKTQTRRVVKPQPGIFGPYKPGLQDKNNPEYMFVSSGPNSDWYRQHEFIENFSPYKKGQRLWVRETYWKYVVSYFNIFGDICWDNKIAYKADGDSVKYTSLRFRLPQYEETVTLHDPFWRPSIKMCREDSRITLEVTSVRLEKVQDISEGDAISEGALGIPNSKEYQQEFDKALRLGIKPPVGRSPRERFKKLFNSIYKKSNWDTNPWVWVIDFKVVEK
jgi:hypothetical protein